MRIEPADDPGLEKRLREQLAREATDNRLGAKALAQACATGDSDAFLVAVDFLNEQTVDGWRLAMMRVARLPSVSDHVRSAFLNVWIESKMLPLRVGNRRVLTDALRILMPCNYSGGPIRLYRGAGMRERRRRPYGFSWTRYREIARGFAEHWQAMSPGGVVLETLAPAEAILLLREDEDYHDEGEIVVDPFRLGAVTVVERLSPSAAG